MSKRWALFLSGRGSTAQALFDLNGDLDISLVVSSKKTAPGILRARRQGIPVRFFSKNDDWNELSHELRRRKVNAIFLVGFMRLLPAEFVSQWAGKIWNIHPSLLPAFAGADAMQESFRQKAPMGVTLHEVTAEMDAGPPVLKSNLIEVSDSDWDSTQLRMARLEQRLLREWARRCG